MGSLARLLIDTEINHVMGGIGRYDACASSYSRSVLVRHSLPWSPREESVTATADHHLALSIQLAGPVAGVHGGGGQVRRESGGERPAKNEIAFHAWTAAIDTNYRCGDRGWLCSCCVTVGRNSDLVTLCTPDDVASSFVFFLSLLVYVCVIAATFRFKPNHGQQRLNYVHFVLCKWNGFFR